VNDLEQELFRKRDPRVLAALRSSTVGVAGAGGLGSNAAACLARAGIGRLIVADFDRLEAPDLNRQHYFADQIGRLKVEALAENLRRMNPFSVCETHPVRIGPDNVEALFGSADLLIEALDGAEEKRMLAETWLRLFPGRPLIMASGLAGFGGNSALRQRDLGGLFIIGDEASEAGPASWPMAPRVMAVAAMQANLAVELLVALKS
jgi:sulfur carrier protein ThiS adenylyltransferase